MGNVHNDIQGFLLHLPHVFLLSVGYTAEALQIWELSAQTTSIETHFNPLNGYLAQST